MVKIGWCVLIKDFKTECNRFVFAGVVSDSFGDFKYCCNDYCLIYDIYAEGLRTVGQRDVFVLDNMNFIAPADIFEKLRQEVLRHMDAAGAACKVCRCLQFNLI